MTRAHHIELGIGVAGCFLLAIGAFWQGAAAAQGWLAAWVFWIGLPVGALFLRLAHGLTGGRWGNALRPAFLVLIGMLPLLGLFVVPVLVGLRAIYPWARDGGVGWLSWPFFCARAILYVVVWNAIAVEGRRDALPPQRAWALLAILFVTASLAAFDWMMTLEPRWVSTIFGLMVTAGWVLSALAAAMLLAFPRGIDASTLDAAARLLLALAILWAYLTVVQLVVIWESNLSGEIVWYLRRGAGAWSLAGAVVALCQFGVPFALLFWRRVRRSRGAVGAVAFLVLAAHLVETWWLTVPDFNRPFGWAEPLAAVAIGGLVLYAAAPRSPLAGAAP